MQFDPQDYPLALQTPHRLTDMSFWQMHIPFAFALTQMLRPGLFVELGTHKGDSYCTFCQAVDTLNLNTTCYAVDTWAGDVHTGQYADAVFDELQAYHDPRYGSFSTLVRGFFDDALDRFDDGSIDLLHIDGTHTYEAVRQDFESWLPKMSRQGVVIMHDVTEHRDNFGVWRLWAELKERYPHFEFPFGHGLGVVAVGDEMPDSMRAFFTDESHGAATAHYFSILGERIVALGEARAEARVRGEAPTEDAVSVISLAQSPDDDTNVPRHTPRLLAFYLPQFHPIPENDLWWGKGFTEWTNVAQAKPLFSGHYQPHIPADLGFYDLRLPETREAQADLAREHGIYGFCYHHYWFKGRRILDRPLDEVLASGRPDFPFCLCWANHNWTRRWDRRERERLIVQEYSEDDDREHIRWLLGVFQDERYIKVNGRPLLLIWRTQDLPNALRTTTLWREEARQAGMPEPYICNVETNGEDGEPHQYGCDAAVEFPPQRMSPHIKCVSGPEDAYYDNQIREYRDLVTGFLELEDAPYRRMPSVVPSWDNTPRFKSRGAGIYRGSTPELYEYWLKGAIEKASSAPPEEQFVFINAWNEWAEGAHLEPDIEHGRAYLEATRRALLASGIEVPASVVAKERDEKAIKVASHPLSIEKRYQHLLDKYVQLQQYHTEQLSEEEHSTLSLTLREHYESVEQAHKRLKARHKELVARHKGMLGRYKQLQERYKSLRARLGKTSGLQSGQSTIAPQPKIRNRTRNMAETNGSSERKSLKEVEKLAHWIQQLDANVLALLASRRWKFAYTLGEIRQRVLLKPRTPTAADKLIQILGEFRVWRRRNSKKDRTE